MPDPTTLATKIVRALWPSEFREQVLDARIATVRGVLEGEKMETKEPSELARKLSVLVRNHLNRIFTLEQGSDRLPQLLADAGLSDLEAKLKAKERELEEARGRLERLASVARYVRSGIDHTESRTECRACALKSVLEELGLATEKDD